MRLLFALLALTAQCEGLKVAVRQLSILQDNFNCDTGTLFSWNPCDLKLRVCGAVVAKGQPAPLANSTEWACTANRTLQYDDASAGSSLDGTDNKDVFNFLDCFKDDPCQFHLPGLHAARTDYVATKWSIVDFDDEKGESGDGDDLLLKDWVVPPVRATTAGDADLAPHFEQCDKDQDGDQFCDSVKLFFNIIPDRTEESPVMVEKVVQVPAALTSAKHVQEEANVTAADRASGKNETDAEMEGKASTELPDQKANDEVFDVKKDKPASAEKKGTGAGSKAAPKDSEAAPPANPSEPLPPVVGGAAKKARQHKRVQPLPKKVQPGMDPHMGEDVARAQAKELHKKTLALRKAKKAERQRLSKKRKEKMAKQEAALKDAAKANAEMREQAEVVEEKLLEEAERIEEEEKILKKAAGQHEKKERKKRANDGTFQANVAKTVNIEKIR